MELQASESPGSVAPVGASNAPAGEISVSAILALLMAAIILPALFSAIILLQRNDRAQQSMVTALAEATAASITQAFERHVEGMETNLRVFSTAQSLPAGNLRQFHQRARFALEGSGTYLIGLDENLQQLFDTRYEFTTPLGEFVEADLGNRELGADQPVVTRLFHNETSHQWSFRVIYPLAELGGPVRFLMLSQPVEGLEKSISSQNLRGGWNAVIIDGNGVVAASSFMSSDIGKPFFLRDEIAEAQGTRHHQIEFDGQTYDIVQSRSETSEWETIVWAPTKTVRAPSARTFRAFAMGGLAIIAIGAVLAWVIGRQITGPIRALARDARRLGAGEEVKAVNYIVSEIATVSEALEQASNARQQAENEIRFLMREVAHRSKNQLTVVSSIAKQTGRHARSFEGFQDAFQKRIHALARSTDLLIAGGVAGVELRELVEVQLEPFRPSGERVTIEGRALRLSNQAAQTLGLALHELATNAAKYGAFASNEGTLQISWKRAADAVEFRWREHVQVTSPDGDKRGFGTEVIERMLGGTLGATIERELRSDGLDYRVIMPIANLEPERAGHI